MPILHTQLLNRYIDVVYRLDGEYKASSHEVEETKEEIVIEAVYFFGKDIWQFILRYDRMYKKNVQSVIYGKIS